MAEEGLITKGEAVSRVNPESLDQLLHPTLDPDAQRVCVGRGLPASPGAASGTIALTADEAEARAGRGEAVILVRVETSPEDIHGMHAAAGILTARGGMTSHAAVVARGMGRPCVSGAGEVRIDMASGKIFIGDAQFKDGDMITIDGGVGEIYQGEIAKIQPRMSEAFEVLMDWADSLRRMKVRTNAETPADAHMAREYGCRRHWPVPD